MYDKNVPLENNSLIPRDHSTVPVTDVFDLKGIERFSKKYDVSIDASSPLSFDMGGWDYFGLGAECACTFALQAKPTEISAFVRDFIVHVAPLARHSYIVSRLKQDIFRRRPLRFFSKGEMVLAAQFRIESDWRFYSAVTLQPTIGDNEDFHITYDRIAGKIKKTIPNAKRILVICDEAAVSESKEDIRHVCKRQFDLDLVWKSDFLTPFEMNALGPLVLSMIDFELAMGADKFVGLSRSTFSNMVTLEKFAAARSRITTDFIYNGNGAHLHQRTDNGAHADPRDATR